MSEHHVLLVCGSGASSGFLAANIRKAAANRDLPIAIIARSEDALEDYLKEIDCLMVGPHMANMYEELVHECEGYPIKVQIIDRTVYSHLDGEGALNQILALFDEK